MSNRGNVVFKSRRKKCLLKRFGVGILVISSMFIGASVSSVMTSKSILAKGDNEVNIPNLNKEMSSVIEKVNPSIVSVLLTDEKGDKEHFSSGVVLEPNGIIMVPNHFVYAASKIEVKTINGEVLDASLIGNDEFVDIALVKVDKEDMEYTNLSKESTSIGETIYLMSTDYDSNSRELISEGKVSSTRRQIYVGNGEKKSCARKIALSNIEARDEFDGSIFIDSKGEVKGINSKLIQGRSDKETCLAFVESREVSRAVNRIRKPKEVIDNGFGVYGGAITDKDDQVIGLYIQGISRGSEADKAGLRPTDILLEMNGKELDSIKEISDIVAELELGDKISCKIRRNDSIEYMEIELGVE